MRKTSVIMSVISAVALLLPVSLWAEHHEEDPQPPLTEVWMVVPKQGMESEFREAVIADVAYREKMGDSRSWQAYTVALGHNMNVVQFRACCFDWADQDAYRDESREKEFSKNWGENVHQYVDHYHRYLERNDWKNSHWPEGSDGPYYGVTSWQVKQGAGPASGEARRKMSQVAKKEGWATEDRNWLWLMRIGGKPMTMIVSSFENYADMAPPEDSFWEFMSEQLGEEEAAAVFSDFASGYSDSDYTVWYRDAEMSDKGDED